jgi:hypothetical protein
MLSEHGIYGFQPLTRLNWIYIVKSIEFSHILSTKKLLQIASGICRVNSANRPARITALSRPYCRFLRSRGIRFISYIMAHVGLKG